MARNLKIYNNQRLSTNQIAASVPVANPGASRPLNSLNVPKRGVMTKAGMGVSSPVQGRLSNRFNSDTNGNARLGSGFVIQYPLSRVVPAMRRRMAGNSGHPVIMKVANTVQGSK